MKKPFPIPVRVRYSCSKCPAYCCSYPEIEVTPRDIERLAKRFELDYREAEERFTKVDAKEKVRLLRHKKDTVFATVCMFLDQKKRRCTVYESRPGVCRAFLRPYIIPLWRPEPWSFARADRACAPAESS